jgi:hypothetical protein
MSPDGERRARVALSFLAKPGDPVLGAALRTRTASEVLALVTGADADGDVLLAGETEDTALARAVERWRDRLGEIPGTSRLAAWQDSGCGWSCLAIRSGRRNSTTWATPGRWCCGCAAPPT